MISTSEEIKFCDTIWITMSLRWWNRTFGRSTFWHALTLWHSVFIWNIFTPFDLFKSLFEIWNSSGIDQRVQTRIYGDQKTSNCCEEYLRKINKFGKNSNLKMKPWCYLYYRDIKVNQKLTPPTPSHPIPVFMYSAKDQWYHAM